MKRSLHIKLGELMVDKRASVDPSKYPDEIFDLYSVPAFEIQEPERLRGGEIGSAKKAIEPGDVLLSRIVPHIRRAWVVGSPSGNRRIGSGEWMIFNSQQAWPGYLRHVLVSDWFHPKLMQTVSGVGGSLLRARPSEVAKIEIPLPPINEQKRIAAILDKADDIRRKRQEALRLTDDFLRSVFLDLFGDPVTNPKGWEVRTLSHGVESFEGGKNVNPTDSDRRDGIRVLKVSAVTSGEYVEAESKPFGEDFPVPSSYLVKKGDLLISRANTSELVGAVAHVWETSGKAMLPDKLWRFVWKTPARIHPLFMLHMARSSHFRKELIARATGSSGSMKNIGKSKMLEIPIPMPPIALQNQFGEIAAKGQAQIRNATVALTEAELLFTSLQQRAFQGEL